MDGTSVRVASKAILVSFLATLGIAGEFNRAAAQEFHFSKGYAIKKPGLIPRYPASDNCSPLTSLYASWDDVDGACATNRIPVSTAGGWKTKFRSGARRGDRCLEGQLGLGRGRRTSHPSYA